MEIRDIEVRSLDIPPVDIIFQSPPYIVFTEPPVTVNIGLPIIDIPGCVEAYNSNSKSKKIGQDDENGLVTFCDGNLPSFNPPQYEPLQILPKPIPKVNTPSEDPENPPEVSQPPLPSSPTIECPTEVQKTTEPIGTYLSGFRLKVVEYRVMQGQCVQITEPVDVPEQVIAGLPSPGAVVMTGTIAVIATTSAIMAKPLGDVLLKVIKPVVKKVMNKIAVIRGKKEKVLSVFERVRSQKQNR